MPRLPHNNNGRCVLSAYPYIQYVVFMSLVVGPGLSAVVRPETDHTYYGGSSIDDSSSGDGESLLASQRGATDTNRDDRSSGDKLPALPSASQRAQKEALREIDEVSHNNGLQGRIRKLDYPPNSSGASAAGKHRVGTISSRAVPVGVVTLLLLESTTFDNRSAWSGLVPCSTSVSTVRNVIHNGVWHCLVYHRDCCVCFECTFPSVSLTYGGVQLGSDRRIYPGENAATLPVAVRVIARRRGQFSSQSSVTRRQSNRTFVYSRRIAFNSMYCF